jgi:multidrug efflux system outer membrane protein
MPQLDLNNGASRLGGPLVNAAGGGGNLFSSTADLSYEVDLFGRLAQASDAATLDAQSREGLLQSTRLLVQADVARTYFALRANDAERGVLQQSIGAFRDTVRLTQRRADAATRPVSRLPAQAPIWPPPKPMPSGWRGSGPNSNTRWRCSSASPPRCFRCPNRPMRPHCRRYLPAFPARSWHGAPMSAAQPARWRPGTPGSGAEILAAQPGADGERGFASPGLSDLFKMSMRAWGVGARWPCPVRRRTARSRPAACQADVDALGRPIASRCWSRSRTEDQLSGLRLLAEQAEIQHRALEYAARATSCRHRAIATARSASSICSMRGAPNAQSPAGAASGLGTLSGHGRTDPRVGGGWDTAGTPAQSAAHGD